MVEESISKEIKEVTIIWNWKNNNIYGKIVRGEDKLTCIWIPDNGFYDHYSIEQVDKDDPLKYYIFSKHVFSYWTVGVNGNIEYTRIGTPIDIYPDITPWFGIKTLKYNGKSIGFKDGILTSNEGNDVLNLSMHYILKKGNTKL